MSTLATRRCLHHETREAVSRCLSCGNFFCRECVVLFESRMLCAACLAQNSGQEALAPEVRIGSGGIVLAVCGLLIAWLLIYLAGWTILAFRDRVPIAETGSLAAQKVT